MSLKFVPKVPINNIPALFQIMAWRRSGDKPLSEPMMVCLLTHICVTQPQWVKECHPTMGRVPFQTHQKSRVSKDTLISLHVSRFWHQYEKWHNLYIIHHILLKRKWGNMIWYENLSIHTPPTVLYNFLLRTRGVVFTNCLMKSSINLHQPQWMMMDTWQLGAGTMNSKIEDQGLFSVSSLELAQPVFSQSQGRLLQ